MLVVATLRRLPTSLLLFIVYTQAACAATQDQASTSNLSSECAKAFHVLFQSEHMDRPNGENLEALADGKPVEFLQYDNACFRSLSETKNPNTLPFIKPILGVMGVHKNGIFLPFCTVFRISSTDLASPVHCWCLGASDTSTRVRLLANPSVDYEVTGPSGPMLATRCPVHIDFDDAIRLKLSGDTLPDFKLPPTDFQGVLLDTMSVAVFGFDQFRFSRNPAGSWEKSMVFSPTLGSSKIPAQWLHPEPTPTQRDSCLYYSSPTYSGMSGALIVGLERKVDQPERLFVAGMHLRAGTGSNAGCGSYLGANIGLSSDYLFKRIGAPQP